MSTNGNGNGSVPKRKRGRPPGPCPTPYTRQHRHKTEGIKSVARDGLDLMLHEVRQVRAYAEGQQAERDGLETRARAGNVEALGELWRRFSVRYPLVERGIVLGPTRLAASYPGSAGPFVG